MMVEQMKLLLIGKPSIYTQYRDLHMAQALFLHMSFRTVEVTPPPFAL
jgi:hypothetical protein